MSAASDGRLRGRFILAVDSNPLRGIISVVRRLSAMEIFHIFPTLNVIVNRRQESSQPHCRFRIFSTALSVLFIDSLGFEWRHTFRYRI
jgi:hypothetical protein